MENFNCLKISVFILGDDKESELVCTTLPVVITAGTRMIMMYLFKMHSCHWSQVLLSFSCSFVSWPRASSASTLAGGRPPPSGDCPAQPRWWPRPVEAATWPRPRPPCTLSTMTSSHTGDFSFNCMVLSFLLVLMFPLVSLTRSLHASDLILLTQTSDIFAPLWLLYFYQTRCCSLARQLSDDGKLGQHSQKSPDDSQRLKSTFETYTTKEQRAMMSFEKTPVSV